MMTTLSAEVVSAVAVVISAIGTAFAAWAAFRSAGSAQSAQQAVAEAERRLAVRHLRLTADEVILEFDRVESRAFEAKQAYTTLFVFAGGSGGLKGCYISAIDEKVKAKTELRDHAQLFTSPTESVRAGRLDEIDRIQTKLSNSRTQLWALREDLEREHASVEAQNAAHREKVIHRLSK